MKVSLVSITKAISTNQLTPEELIVYIARVSNPGNQMNTETSERLIRYLISNKHWSPFEMVDMTVEIVTSRGIAQQILRHRSFSFQEFSQRYAEVTDFEPIELRRKADSNRQSSSALLTADELLKWNTQIQLFLNWSEDLYKDMLMHGIAKECARFILPITTQTKIYMKGSVRSWIHYLLIRLDEHTQKEHREVAFAIAEIFKAEFPMIGGYVWKGL